MGKKKRRNSSYLAGGPAAAAVPAASTAAATATAAVACSSSSGAFARSASPSTAPCSPSPAQMQSREEPVANPTPSVTHPDLSKAANMSDAAVAVDQVVESFDGCRESGAGDHGLRESTSGRDSEEAEGKEGEVDETTPPTRAPRTASATGTDSPGLDGAWLCQHLQQHAEAGTCPQQWTLHLAVGRFGGIPATNCCYTQAIPSSATGTNSAGLDGAWLCQHLQQHAEAGTCPQQWALHLAMGRLGEIPANCYYTQAIRSSATGTVSAGLDGAWLCQHLQQHAEAGTCPQDWVLNLAMGRFGGIQANNCCNQFQATLADTVSEVEALKETVSALQHSRGRAEYSSSSSGGGGSRDWKASRDGAEICARCDRSLGRAGGDRNFQKREAQAPHASTNPTAAPARRAFDSPSDYFTGYRHPSSHSRAAYPYRSYEEASLERVVSAMDDDDAANSGAP